MSIIDFVKEHPKMYIKENACYVEKAQKDAIGNCIGEEIGRTGPEVHYVVQHQDLLLRTKFRAKCQRPAG